MYQRYSFHGGDSPPTIMNGKTKPTTDLPSPTGLDYDGVNDWAKQDLEENIRNEKSRELFTKFLETCLAAENVRFVQAVQDFESTKSGGERKSKAKAILKRYSSKLNIEPSLQEEVAVAAQAAQPPVESYTRTKDHVLNLLRSDLFPRYLKSDIYLGFLEQLLTPPMLKLWAKNLEALLGNTVGRWRFRKFLRKTHADENLRFVESVHDYKRVEDKAYRVQKAKTVFNQFLCDQAPTQIHILDKDRKDVQSQVFGSSRKSSKGSARTGQIEIRSDIFDEAVRTVMGYLRDPYLRFLHSKDFTSLMRKAEQSEKQRNGEPV